MWSESLLHNPFESAYFFRPEMQIVVVEGPEVGREFIGFGCTKGRTV